MPGHVTLPLFCARSFCVGKTIVSCAAALISPGATPLADEILELFAHVPCLVPTPLFCARLSSVGTAAAPCCFVL